jgi:hypothetical protein
MKFKKKIVKSTQMRWSLVRIILSPREMLFVINTAMRETSGF